MRQLEHVRCRSSDSCVAVGWSVVGGQVNPDVDVFSGGSWTAARVPATVTGQLLGVACTGKSCVAVGGSPKRGISLFGARG
jgi:hypothetical protein